MELEARRAIRVYHKDFQDYFVNIEIEGIFYRGNLGNISETGLCAILPEDFVAMTNIIVSGSVEYIPLKDHLDFIGRIAWKTPYEFHRRKFVMIGMEFTQKIIFPEYLLALNLSFDT
jgi:hypothetical protein